MKRRRTNKKTKKRGQRGGIIGDIYPDVFPRPSPWNPQFRQQAGAGLAMAFRSLTTLLRRLGPQLAHLTRSFRTPKTGLQAYKSQARNFARSAHKQARRTHKNLRKLATKKNLKRAAKAGAIAAGTGAIGGAAQYGIQKLLRGKDED